MKLMVEAIKEYSSICDKETGEYNKGSLGQIFSYLAACGARLCKYEKKKLLYNYSEDQTEGYRELLDVIYDDDVIREVVESMFVDAKNTKNEDDFELCANFLLELNIFIIPELRDDHFINLIYRDNDNEEYMEGEIEKMKGTECEITTGGENLMLKELKK